MKQWEHEKPKDRYTVRVERGGKPVAGVQSDRISRIDEEVMYWRKANHIHGWFVDNVQNGHDDCREYDVDEDRLRDLLERCDGVIAASKLVDGVVTEAIVYDKEHPTGVPHRVPGKVIENPAIARQLLPTRDGCFFGSDEYHEYYLYEVVRTRDWVERTLADNKAGVPGDVIYSSSW